MVAGLTPDIAFPRTSVDDPIIPATDSIPKALPVLRQPPGLPLNPRYRLGLSIVAATVLASAALVLAADRYGKPREAARAGWDLGDSGYDLGPFRLTDQAGPGRDRGRPRRRRLGRGLHLHPLPVVLPADLGRDEGPARSRSATPA